MPIRGTIAPARWLRERARARVLIRDETSRRSHGHHAWSQQNTGERPSSSRVQSLGRSCLQMKTTGRSIHSSCVDSKGNKSRNIMIAFLAPKGTGARLSKRVKGRHGRGAGRGPHRQICDLVRLGEGCYRKSHRVGHDDDSRGHPQRMPCPSPAPFSVQIIFILKVKADFTLQPLPPVQPWTLPAAEPVQPCTLPAAEPVQPVQPCTLPAAEPARPLDTSRS